MTAVVEPDIQRLKCPVCGEYIGSTQGGYFESRPCKCGATTIVRINRERLLKRVSNSNTIPSTT